MASDSVMGGRWRWAIYGLGIITPALKAVAGDKALSNEVSRKFTNKAIRSGVTADQL